MRPRSALALLAILAIVPVNALAQTSETADGKLEVLWEFDTGG